MSPRAGGGARPSRTTWIRAALWCAGLACYYVAFFHQPDNVALLLALFLLGAFLPGWGEGYAQRRRRTEWAAQFASAEELRLLVTDEAEFRRLRDEKGVLAAVRRLRRAHPRCPLPLALELVQSL
ncbi:hypothetical protein K388_04910 [Streptomyces sp. KhCrAH-43]|uniref:hypothetical protein n=1 Tax=unclassified Streptomyces TaxID=2593676 RepID=UPI000DC2DCAB|nr:MULTISPECIES: hypothetical protein [unclassified Streptomyces]RAJ55990.1 hypothetical protein K388_04910 [Streptomyces sp. KhCrAH-43]